MNHIKGLLDFVPGQGLLPLVWEAKEHFPGFVDDRETNAGNPMANSGLDLRRIPRLNVVVNEDILIWRYGGVPITEKEERKERKRKN